MRYTFSANERLKREQHINTLFHSGKAFSVFPLRVLYSVTQRTAEFPSPVMAGFSVPKKKFRRSVDRHRIRRLMVEAWRLNKHMLYEAIRENEQMHLFLIFTGSEEPEYKAVAEAVVKIIAQLLNGSIA